MSFISPMTENQRSGSVFQAVHRPASREIEVKTAKAQALKECAMGLWQFARRGAARKAWESWLSCANRSRLEPVTRVAGTIRRPLWGIVHAIVRGATNAVGESINSRIQWIKKMACAFRNRMRFRNAIDFHFGGIDLYPAAAGFTHTKA